jgi:hypothetical protein
MICFIRLYPVCVLLCIIRRELHKLILKKNSVPPLPSIFRYRFYVEMYYHSGPTPITPILQIYTFAMLLSLLLIVGNVKGTRFARLPVQRLMQQNISKISGMTVVSLERILVSNFSDSLQSIIMTCRTF